MDEQTSMRTCTYGGSDGLILVSSNLPQPYLDEWLAKLEQIDRKTPFLQPDQDLTLINTSVDAYFSRAIADQLSSDLAVPGLETICRDKSTVPEKFTRGLASGRTPYAANSAIPGHAFITDSYGITYILPGISQVNQLEYQLDRSPSLKIMEKERIEKPNTYTATQLKAVWTPNTAPTGSVVDIHLVTQAEHLNNTQGQPSHQTYDQTKGERPHYQGDNQLIVLQRNKFAPVRLVPVPMANEFAKYTLIEY